MPCICRAYMKLFNPSDVFSCFTCGLGCTLNLTTLEQMKKNGNSRLFSLGGSPGMPGGSLGIGIGLSFSFGERSWGSSSIQSERLISLKLVAEVGLYGKYGSNGSPKKPVNGIPSGTQSDISLSGASIGRGFMCV